MAVTNEHFKEIVGNNRHQSFRSPFFNPLDDNYVLDNSSYFDKAPVDGWVESHSFRGCQALICRSKKDEFAYYHIHPTQVDRGLDTPYIEKTLQENSISPYELLVVTTNKTLLRENFLMHLKGLYPSAKIQEIHIQCEGNNSCDLYFNSQHGKLIIAENLGFNEKKYHEYNISWEKIIRGNFFKPKEEVDETERYKNYEQRAYDYFFDLIMNICGGNLIDEGYMSWVLNSTSIGEICNKSAVLVERVETGDIDCEEVSLSINILKFLASRRRFSADQLEHEARHREDEFKPRKQKTCCIC